MAERITPRNENFPQWYQDIVLQAKLADYSPVKGCMVVRPNGYSIWERIQAQLDRRIKAKNVRNAAFPLLIPESFLQKEAEHVEGFSPELAVVTHAGGKDLDERLVLRPTSETIINHMFSKWIQSYRDLPFMVNQWANVIRWEMRTRLFLRTTEFFWQEGHTCHATPEDAERMTLEMLGVYKEFCENVLAVPVYHGLKTDNERFAGAKRTYTIEAMMQDGKALQAGTSHNLADNFAKAFETQYLDQDGQQKFVHQTSWGVSTRLVGAMIMTHSDDNGLILPPKLAETHIVILPIMGKDPKQKDEIIKKAHKLKEDIEAQAAQWGLDYTVGVKVDDDPNKKPGWKFHEAELLGIPLRVELGPRDLEKEQVVVTRRDIGKKEFIKLTDLFSHLFTQLNAMQSELLERAIKMRDERTFRVKTYEEFKEKVESQPGFYTSHWCGDSDVEEKVKQETKATIRCIILDENNKPIQEDEPCMVTGKKGPNYRVIFARNY